MNRETSLYLDLVRFSAALVVFFGHVGSRIVSNGFLWRLDALGEPAVIVFFVLSGWVIAYAVDQRERSPRSYFVARAARIYSVALPAILLVTLLDAIGSAARPDLYVQLDSMNSYPGHPFLSTLTSLVFLNEAWGLDATPGSDGPYWSLGYECIYYVIFGMSIFLPGRIRLISLAAVCLLIGPRVLSLFPVWLLGFGSYRLSRTHIPLCLGRPMFAISTAAITILALCEIWHKIAMLPVITHQEPQTLLVDYLLALLFATHLLGAAAVSHSWRWLAVIARPIRWLAGATFSLYLFHFPILICLSAKLPFPRESWAFRLTLIGGSLGLVFLLAEATERRKMMWRCGFDWFVGFLSGLARASSAKA